MMSSARLFRPVVLSGLVCALALTLAGCPSTPEVSISASSELVTSTGPVSYDVTYANATEVLLDPVHVTLEETGTAAGTVSVSGEGVSERTVTISDITGRGTLNIALDKGTARGSGGRLAPAVTADTPVTVSPTLVPGAGWTGPTPQPDPIGDPGAPGIDAKAIARWDVVPYQTFDGYFEIGVVAFHINGIDRVEFSVEGGPWLAVQEMTLNPRTNVVEYWATLDANDFPDGPIEVRAIAYPEVGIPRVLGGPIDGGEAFDKGEHSMFLNSNGQQTLWTGEYYVSWSIGSDETGDGTQSSPFKSMGKALITGRNDNPDSLSEGVRILLMPGEHPSYTHYDADGGWLGYGNTVDRYVTVEPAPGVSKSQAVITGGIGLRTRLVHVKDATVRCSLRQSVPVTGDDGVLWADGCDLIGEGRSDTTDLLREAGYGCGVFATDVDIQQVNKGCLATFLVRNTSIHDIAGDAIVNVRTALNVSISDTQPLPGDGIHPDVLQYYTVNPPFENLILFNVHATDTYAQGWHIAYTGHEKGGLWADIALVNLLLDQNSNYTAQWIPSANHVLWWNLTIPAGATLIRNNPTDGAGQGEVTQIDNFDMRNCVFFAFALREDDVPPSLTDDGWANENHYIDPSVYGTSTPGGNVTTGQSPSALFVNPDQHSYTPINGSVLTNRVTEEAARVHVDALNRAITEWPAAIGALREGE